MRIHDSPRGGPTRTKLAIPWKWGVVGVAMLAVAIIGYLQLRPTTPPAQGNGPPFPTSFRSQSLRSGAWVPVVRGRRMTIVMLMASWCLYCAYEDKYVWPQVARSFSGVQINIIDVSAKGGIGDPGPFSPPFTGHDNVGHPISARAMRATMSRYQKQFGLTNARIHVFVDPSGLTFWHVTTFPTLLFVGPHGHLIRRVDGALTAPQMLKLITGL